MLKRACISRLFGVAVVLVGFAAWAGADSLPLTPLTLTGYNLDAMWGPDGGNGGGRAYGHSNGSFSFYVNGTVCKEGTAPPNPGLPTGDFASMTDSTHTYRFAPAGGDDLLNNMLRLLFKDNQSGTLSLATAGKYDQIGVLAHVSNTDTYRDINVTLNYADSTNESLTVRVYKDSQSTNAAIRPWRGQYAYGGLDELTSASGWNQIYICEVLLDVDPNKTLQSVTFNATYAEGDTASNRTLGVYAISGHAVPEPASLSLLTLGGLALLRKHKP